MAERVALVTGCSTGIGRATALALQAAGFATWATARRPETLADLEAAGCHVAALDVTDEPSRRAAVDAVLAAHGRIDVLVNNAGYAAMGTVEDVPLDEWRRQFETNVFGPVRLAQLVLPTMRAQRSGRIVNVSSMGGRLTFPVGGAYHASKYALESLTDALRFEAAQFGVRAVLIEPGSVATAFADNVERLVVRYPESAWPRMSAEMDRQVVALTPRGVRPERVAKVIVRAATRRRPAPRYLVGKDARTLVPLRRWIGARGWDVVLGLAFRAARDGGVRRSAPIGE
jgi:NAD(P)-dependent dehydrogenase (short-subunit alcohol dehydrogenase family)